MTFRKHIATIAALVMLGSAGQALALHPELQVPEKVEAKNQACQIMFGIAKKYSIEGVFSKEFEEGKQCLNRVEFAASLELLTERLAEKVVKEGSSAVARDDLDKLADIREEMRAEMLLVNTRTFQQRNELLGTLLHPLTKNISLSGGLVGVFQSSAGRSPRDDAAVVGRGDLVFNFRVGENTSAVVDVEATGGDGIDAKIPNLSGLNGVAGSTGDRVRFRQAWVEHSMFDDKLIATIGKIDLTNYFDSNAIANDENSQFLSSAFVNGQSLAVPDQGPGVRISAKPAESLIFSIGYGSGDASGDAILNHGFGIAELDYKLKTGELEGNYRVYGALDGALPVRDDKGDITSNKQSQNNSYNIGLSIDQQLTDKLTIFARYGVRDRDAYLTNSSWSTGLQYTGIIPGRPDDIIAFAYGQILGKGKDLPAQEKLAEWYYKVKVSEKIAISPIIQYLIDPQGNPSADNVVALGIRSQVSF